MSSDYRANNVLVERNDDNQVQITISIATLDEPVILVFEPGVAVKIAEAIFSVTDLEEQ